MYSLYRLRTSKGQLVNERMRERNRHGRERDPLEADSVFSIATDVFNHERGDRKKKVDSCRLPNFFRVYFFSPTSQSDNQNRRSLVQSSVVGYADGYRLIELGSLSVDR